MSLVTYPQSPQYVKQAEDNFLPIAVAINDYWQPIQTWTTVAPIAFVISMLILQQQEKAGLLRLYAKLPSTLPFKTSSKTSTTSNASP
jgi:hypothetical protein